MCGISFKCSKRGIEGERRVLKLTLVAEHATPARLAVALPGSGARAMHTTWVSVALLAVATPPAHLASVKEGE